MHGLRLLAIGSVLAVYGLILFGGIVRITDSGMGCGPDWPLCNGEVIPSSWNMATTLEYLHRVFALVVILASVMLLLVGWRLRHQSRWYLILPLVAVGLVMVQSGLGAVTVLLDLHAEVTTAHHLIAQIFLGTLIALGILTHRERLSSEISRFGTPRVTRAGIIAGVSTILLLVAGAYTATTGAGYACPEWPLCSGYFVPGTGSIYVDTQLTHRWLAMLSAAAVGYLIYEIFRGRPESRFLRSVAVALGLLMLIQILVGAINIWTQMHPLFAALHLALATLIWGLVVAVVTVTRLRLQPVTVTAIAPIESGKHAPIDR